MDITNGLSEDADLILTFLDEPELEENFALEETDPALPVPGLDDEEEEDT
jgi:hypothetical protein